MLWLDTLAALLCAAWALSVALLLGHICAGLLWVCGPPLRDLWARTGHPVPLVLENARPLAEDWRALVDRLLWGPLDALAPVVGLLVLAVALPWFVGLGLLELLHRNLPPWLTGR